jgi:hypothetical protein
MSNMEKHDYFIIENGTLVKVNLVAVVIKNEKETNGTGIQV